MRLLEVIDDKLYQKVYMGQFVPILLPPPLTHHSLSLYCVSTLLVGSLCQVADSITVMEFLGGGEIKWRDSKSNPILRVDQSRRICRDVILGLEYRS